MKPETITRKIKKDYSGSAKIEWERLSRDPFHELEFNTTMLYLKKYLPKDGVILDAGSGPGRYAIELAKQGYIVVLLDLVNENLEFAKKQVKKEKLETQINRFEQGSITNLSKFESGLFDAVLCLGGPLSHVYSSPDRRKAISELARVAKKDAPIFISVMGKWGILSTSLVRWPNEIAMKKHFEEMYQNGEDHLWHGGKSYAHYFQTEELKKLVSPKISIITTVGLEGLASPSQEAFNSLAYNQDQEGYKNWLEMHKKICTIPSVVDFSMHFMVVGRKK